LHVDKNAIAKDIYDSIVNGNGDNSHTHTHWLDVLLDYVGNVKSEKIKKVSDTITCILEDALFTKS
jgi:hypothetical protein